MRRPPGGPDASVSTLSSRSRARLSTFAAGAPRLPSKWPAVTVRPSVTIFSGAYPLQACSPSELEDLDARSLLERVTSDDAFGRVALVSSFGADSAVLLHLAAQVAPRVPVLMIDTGRLFDETLRYAETLTRRFGLENLRVVRPAADRLAVADPDGELWRADPDRCCEVRKTRPLRDALVEYDSWITGRKRFQTEDRSVMPKVEFLDGRWKINPLADWGSADIAAYGDSLGLPPHPLVEQGYASIGCYTCTTQVQPGEDARAGRWRGRAKTECGIHLAPSGALSARLPSRG